MRVNQERDGYALFLIFKDILEKVSSLNNTTHILIPKWFLGIKKYMTILTLTKS